MEGGFGKAHGLESERKQQDVFHGPCEVRQRRDTPANVMVEALLSLNSIVLSQLSPYL